jgi:hypothetical protein
LRFSSILAGHPSEFKGGRPARCVVGPHEVEQVADPPQVVLRRCREMIDQHASTAGHESLITVTQVFTRPPELRAIPQPPEPWDPADEPEPKA